MTEQESNQLAKILNSYADSKDPDDRLYATTYLFELLRIGERLYKLNPKPEIKEALERIKSRIEEV